MPARLRTNPEPAIQSAFSQAIPFPASKTQSRVIKGLHATPSWQGMLFGLECRVGLDNGIELQIVEDQQQLTLHWQGLGYS